MKNFFICGLAGSGKDTIAGMLPGYTRVAFGDSVKEACKILREEGEDKCLNHMIRITRKYCFNRYESLQILRELRGLPQTNKDRRLLQEFGTDWARQIDDCIWIKAAIKKIHALQEINEPIVVTDCRFPNEFVALTGMGFVSVAVDANKEKRIERLTLRDGECDLKRLNHSSEASIGDLMRKCDLWIDNNTTIARLQHQVAARIAQGEMIYVSIPNDIYT